jgi:hypothetical protein
MAVIRPTAAMKNKPDIGDIVHPPGSRFHYSWLKESDLDRAVSEIGNFLGHKPDAPGYVQP